MHLASASRSLRALTLVLGPLALAGCAQVLGLGDYKDGAAGGSGGSGGSGSTTTSSSTTTTGASSSSSGGGPCTQGMMQACFDGMPPAMPGKGICKGGMQSCDANDMWGPCMGQVLPMPETCANTMDEDCDGNECALWAKLYGDADYQTISGAAVDSMGNLVITGTFQGTLNLDPANPITANGKQVYLAKLAPSGNVLWQKVFASSGGPPGGVSSAGITIDGMDNIIITGGYLQTINFGGAPLSTLDYYPSYVAKFDSSGSHIFSAPLDFDDLTSVTPPAVDSQGNVYLFGIMNCGATCLPHTTNLWLQKMSPSGSVLFHKNFYVSPTDNDRTAGGLTVDAFGNIFAVGSFAGTETFGKTSFVSAGGFDAFVARFDTSTGTLLNKFTFGDAANQSANAVTVDSGGNVYVVGTYSGHLSPLTLQSQGGSDIFVMRMSALGVLSWSKSFGDPTDQVASAITVSPAGATPQQLVFTGATHGSVDFGGGQIAGKGGVDIPLVKLDSTTGAHVWSRIYGGPADQSGTSVVLANGGRSYLTANTAGGLDAGTGPLSFAGGLDVLLAEFAP